MKFFIPLLLIFNFAYSDESCLQEYSLTEVNNSYNIHVYDMMIDEEEDEEDLELEAKMFLLNHQKNENGTQKLYGVSVHNFTLLKSWKCTGNFLHAIYHVDKENITNIYSKDTLSQDNSNLSYRGTRKRIIGKIAMIEARGNLDLKDYELLYNLYFSIGKIRDTNRIMDTIMELKMEGN